MWPVWPDASSGGANAAQSTDDDRRFAIKPACHRNP
jgi:hypothetical protein